jgi:prepilin-type N-terminal cleavage/methylation domain-containing protein
MHTRIKQKRNKLGFTLAEVLVAMAIFTVVSTGATLSFSMGLRAYRLATAETDASLQASTTLSRIAYGIGNNCGLRAAFVPVTALSGNDGWQITFSVPKDTSGADVQVSTLRYDRATKKIMIRPNDNTPWTTIGRNIVNSTISTTGTSVEIMVQARATIGMRTVTSTKTSLISFRN